jgi:hypothetical protein
MNIVDAAVIFSSYGILCPGCFFREIRERIYRGMNTDSLEAFREKEKEAVLRFFDIIGEEPKRVREGERFFARLFDVPEGTVYAVSRDSLFVPDFQGCARCELPF